jgi:uncharacterized protein
MSTADSFVVMAKPVGPICNLDCGYCYYLGKTGLFPPGEHFRMSPQVLESYVSSFIASSPGPVVHFGWHGGEPTLAGIDFYRQVVELQDRYLPAGWRCLNNIQTNGTLLNARWCSFLAEHHFAVGSASTVRRTCTMLLVPTGTGGPPTNERCGGFACCVPRASSRTCSAR